MQLFVDLQCCLLFSFILERCIAFAVSVIDVLSAGSYFDSANNGSKLAISLWSIIWWVIIGAPLRLCVVGVQGRGCRRQNRF